MEKYFLIGLIAMGVLLIICFTLIYMLYSKLCDMKKRQLRLSEQLGNRKAEDVLLDIFDEESSQNREIDIIKKEIGRLKDRQNKCFDKVKIIRYHTTSDNEAKLSYSVGLSNEDGDGLVITGLQYRQGCNMYYKQVREGVPDYDLSPEEKRSLDRTSAVDVMGRRS